jgi:DNA-binding transcriptional LysR family regulator
MRGDELADLNVFLAVAEENSFTRAAAKLGTSQSALSYTIRRLETRLGVRLLTRTTRRVAPAEAGERLLRTLRPALGDIETELRSLGELREKPAGTIRAEFWLESSTRPLVSVRDHSVPFHALQQLLRM